MSKDFTFKENMTISKISSMPPFGVFTAKYDKGEIFLGQQKNLTNTEKITLYRKLLEDHINDLNINFSDSKCSDVAEFLLDYLTEIDISGSEFDELKSTLEELKTSNGTLDARETFKFILNYSRQIGIFKEEFDIEK